MSFIFVFCCDIDVPLSLLFLLLLLRSIDSNVFGFVHHYLCRRFGYWIFWKLDVTWNVELVLLLSSSSKWFILHDQFIINWLRQLLRARPISKLKRSLPFSTLKNLATRLPFKSCHCILTFFAFCCDEKSSVGDFR